MKKWKQQKRADTQFYASNVDTVLTVDETQHTITPDMRLSSIHH